MVKFSYWDLKCPFRAPVETNNSAEVNSITVVHHREQVWENDFTQVRKTATGDDHHHIIITRHNPNFIDFSFDLRTKPNSVGHSIIRNCFHIVRRRTNSTFSSQTSIKLANDR